MCSVLKCCQSPSQTSPWVCKYVEVWRQMSVPEELKHFADNQGRCARGYQGSSPCEILSPYSSLLWPFLELTYLCCKSAQPVQQLSLQESVSMFYCCSLYFLAIIISNFNLQKNILGLLTEHYMLKLTEE